MRRVKIWTLVQMTASLVTSSPGLSSRVRVDYGKYAIESLDVEDFSDLTCPRRLGHLAQGDTRRTILDILIILY